MSDNVNGYGLGAPGTQSGTPVPHDPRTAPLAHGLGGSDADENLTPKGGKPDPLSHGLGSAGAGSATGEERPTS